MWKVAGSIVAKRLEIYTCYFCAWC